LAPGGLSARHRAGRKADRRARGAVYFKSGWQWKFKAAATRPAPDVRGLLDFVRLSGGGRELRLWLPRFRIESDLGLRPHCEALGIVDAFGPQADFSGVSSEPGFALGEVLHRAFADVDEEGTEAGAATVAMMLAAALWAPKPREVRVDRPFLFVISDRPTGSILFMGRVVDPRGV
jgi:serpin B